MTRQNFALYESVPHDPTGSMKRLLNRTRFRSLQSEVDFAFKKSLERRDGQMVSFFLAPQEETEAPLPSRHLWDRMNAGQVLGVDYDCLPCTLESAKALKESLKLRHEIPPGGLFKLGENRVDNFIEFLVRRRCYFVAHALNHWMYQELDCIFCWKNQCNVKLHCFEWSLCGPPCHHLFHYLEESLVGKTQTLRERLELYIDFPFQNRIFSKEEWDPDTVFVWNAQSRLFAACVDSCKQRHRQRHLFSRNLKLLQTSIATYGYCLHFFDDLIQTHLFPKVCHFLSDDSWKSREAQTMKMIARQYVYHQVTFTRSFHEISTIFRQCAIFSERFPICLLEEEDLESLKQFFYQTIIQHKYALHMLPGFLKDQESPLFGLGEAVQSEVLRWVTRNLKNSF